MNAELNSRAFIGGVDVLSEKQYVMFTRERIALEKQLDVLVYKKTITQAQADYQLAQFDRRINDHIGSLRNVDTATANYASTVDDLRGRIAGALTPTFDLSGLTGGLLGQMGGDTFDEAYKRLAAVALRPEELQIHAGDWADTFEQAGLTGLTPEEAQQRARELVEAYSKGLDFSLIDREKIKDQVRQAIKAQEIYDTIVDEIYAEMGKENTKLQSAGTKLGNQLNKATTAAVQSGAADYVGAWLDVLEPALIRRLDARYRRTGETLQ
jgi:predicted ATPase